MKPLLWAFGIGAGIVLLPFIILGLIVFGPIFGPPLLLLFIITFGLEHNGKVVYSRSDIEQERLKYQAFLTSSHGQPKSWLET